MQLTNDVDEQGIQKLLFRDGYATVAAKAFFDYFDISHERTLKAAVKHDSEKNMLLLTVRGEDQAPEVGEAGGVENNLDESY